MSTRLMSYRCEVHIPRQCIRHNRRVMPPANLRRVAHQCCDLEQAHARLGKLTAERVPIVETSPSEGRISVGGAGEETVSG